MKYRAIIFDFVGTLFFSTEELAPSAKDLLDYCKNKGMIMLAVTMASYNTEVISRLGLDSCFAEIKIVGAGESKNRDLFLSLLGCHGLIPEQVIGVGDSLSQEIRGMKQAGITSVWIKNSWNSGRKPLEDSKPDYQVSSLKEVMNILETAG